MHLITSQNKVKQTQSQGEIDKSTITMEDFNIPLPAVRAQRGKKYQQGFQHNQQT